MVEVMVKKNLCKRVWGCDSVASVERQEVCQVKNLQLNFSPIYSTYCNFQLCYQDIIIYKGMPVGLFLKFDLKERLSVYIQFQEIQNRFQ